MRSSIYPRLDHENRCNYNLNPLTTTFLSGQRVCYSHISQVIQP